MPISQAETVGFQLIPNASGEYHLSYPKVAEDIQYTAERLDYYIFHMPESSVENPKYTADFFKNVPCDTILYIHRYNELQENEITVTYESSVWVAQAGETVKVHVSFDGWSDLDVENVSVVSVRQRGTEYEVLNILAEANAPGTLSFEAEESFTIGVLVTNEVSNVLTDIREFTVIPDFEVTSIAYETITNLTQRYSEEFPGETEASISVTEGDEVTLTILTNVDEINEAREKDPSLDEFLITYSWNKNGVSLPASVNILEEGNKLSFTTYSKDLHDGIYNCIISSGTDQLVTVSFEISASYPTNHSVITESESTLYVAGNLLHMTHVKGLVRIYNMNGKLVQTIHATGGTSIIPLNHHVQGVYIITCDAHTVKAIVR